MPDHPDDNEDVLVTRAEARRMLGGIGRDLIGSRRQAEPCEADQQRQGPRVLSQVRGTGAHAASAASRQSRKIERALLRPR